MEISNYLDYGIEIPKDDDEKSISKEFDIIQLNKVKEAEVYICLALKQKREWTVPPQQEIENNI